jgi:RNA polymerase sigma-70 factor (ECF subfamily)
LEPLNDNALMMQVRAGEISRLGLLYERYSKMLFGFFYRNTTDQEVSEDLVQNVFERILKFRKQFRGEGKFTSWMYSIARNELADYYKKQRRRYHEVEYAPGRDDILDEPFKIAENQEIQLKLVEKSLRKLKSDRRELLILSRYQGLKYKEIAEMYHVSEGSIKVKIFRALNDLRQIYHELEKSNIYE